MMKPKIIVRYLPQFHRVKENDEWWGDGFTDWTTVKNGKALFENHRQPRRPLADNYYNLMEKDTMQWQADLAQKYGIDGFAFYHYWFKDGRQILEKPAENLLGWQKIQMPFCFCWANETWSRTWSNLMSSNVWANDFEKKTDDSENGVLLDQKYGLYDEWNKHINYLIPFFKDERYIKKDGKPVFMIYHPEELHCLPDMIEYWNCVLRKNDIKGVYIIAETQNECISRNSVVDSRLIRFPDCAFQQLSVKRLDNGIRLYDYDEYWENILSNEWNWIDDEKTYMCIAPDFDTTPRKGVGGIALSGVTVKKFKHYFKRLYAKALSNNEDYIFINAWNEWGEGAYLEPDTENRFEYLEAIRDAVSDENYEVGILSVHSITAHEKKIMPRWIRDNHAMKAFYNWMLLHHQQRDISDYLKEHKFFKVAIYGYGYLGKMLVDELKNEHMDIEYIIDRDANAKSQNVKVYGLTKNIPYVDVIIVTPAGQYDDIRNEIRKFVTYKTISLEFILSELI